MGWRVRTTMRGLTAAWLIVYIGPSLASRMRTPDERRTMETISHAA